MSKQLYTVSKEGLEYLCGLINKIVTLPSDVISDITLSTNKTMSSVKIDKIIKQCLQDANEYSNEVVNSLTHLVAKKIDFEPTLDNTTDKINTLLLYSANSDNNYTQYLRLTNELLNLGDTSLSLNEYIKVVDADTKYTLKTATDTLTTEVNNIKSDFTTHKNDADIHMTQDEKDNIVKKDDIVSNLDSTVTNTQLIDGKTLVDKFNSIEDNFSRRYDFDNIRHKRTIDRRLAIKTVIDTFKKAGATNTSIDYYKKNSVFIIRYNQGYYYTYIMTSYFNKVFILEYSVYNTDMILWVEDETGELYIRGTIPITSDVIRFVKPFTTNKDKYKLYDGQYTIDENTKTCTLTVSIDCLSPASTSTNFGTLNELNFKTPSSPRTFDLKAEGTSTDTIKFYLGEMYCQIWGGTAGKRYTGTVTYTIK